MLPEEAQWLGREILALDRERAFPLLDIGSSTDHFRKVEQPFIDELIFRPIREAGGQIVHSDFLNLPGVDLVGDLTDPNFQQRLRSMRFGSVLCNNLMEHLTNREEIARILVEILPPGGHLIVSVPYRYPYHAGPIDTGYRPTPQQLAELFGGMETIKGEVVPSHTYWEDIGRDPLYLAGRFFRLLFPFYNPRGWLTVASHIPWLGRRFEVSCVVLRKR